MDPTSLFLWDRRCSQEDICTSFPFTFKQMAIIMMADDISLLWEEGAKCLHTFWRRQTVSIAIKRSPKPYLWLLVIILIVFHKSVPPESHHFLKSFVKQPNFLFYVPLYVAPNSLLLLQKHFLKEMLLVTWDICAINKKKAGSSTLTSYVVGGWTQYE